MSAGSVRGARPARRIFSELLEHGTVDLDDQARCVKCGCTDEEGCPEGCTWLAVDRRIGEGVCSCCGDALDTWRRVQ